jgi:hypothetical protein
MLKKVPEHIKLNPYKGGLDDDPRWVFFQNQGERARFGTIMPHIYLNSGVAFCSREFARAGTQGDQGVNGKGSWGQ